MTPSSSSPPRRQSASPAPARQRKLKDAADFLKTHDAMASLMPTVARLAALQKDYAAALPAMFNYCDVLQLDSGNLVLSAPNAALATKLKQQLPKLQEHLQKGGWQVNAIRIKVQVAKNRVAPPVFVPLELPQQALSALADLGRTLEDTPRNQDLKNALDTLVQRHLSHRRA